MTISSTDLLSSQSATTPPTSANSNSNSILGKNGFLQLLVTQLKNQDPTSPMKSDQFVSQLAQFTSLEQTQNMSDAITQFVNSQSSLGTQASMIGKTITWTDSTTGNTQTGLVSAVSLKSGATTYIVDGNNVNPSEITEIQQQDPTSTSGTSNSTVPAQTTDSTGTGSSSSTVPAQTMDSTGTVPAQTTNSTTTGSSTSGGTA